MAEEAKKAPELFRAGVFDTQGVIERIGSGNQTARVDQSQEQHLTSETQLRNRSAGHPAAMV